MNLSGAMVMDIKSLKVGMDTKDQVDLDFNPSSGTRICPGTCMLKGCQNNILRGKECMK